MPLLLYCIAEAAVAVKVSVTGVGGQLVEGIEQENLRCFVSQNVTATLPAGGSTRDTALTFHRVLQEIFIQAAIIPFRFPTTVEDEAALKSLISEHGQHYRDALQRLRDMVQMEVRITPKDLEARKDASDTLSGTEYLRRRRARDLLLQAAAAAVRGSVDAWISAWRQRNSAQGARVFLLVERSKVAQLPSALAGAQIGPEVLVRVSGPWPATEFLDNHV